MNSKWTFILGQHIQTETGREVSSAVGSCRIFHHHGDICVSLVITVSLNSFITP